MRTKHLFKSILSAVLFAACAVLAGCGGDSNGFNGNQAALLASDTSANSTPTYGRISPFFGVVAFYNGGIGIIDGKNQTVSPPLLLGELGSIGGSRFDVAITPDGRTTLVSNFGDGTVYFIDTSDPAKPMVKGSVKIGFFAEDIDITPDGRYALVTDGGFTRYIAVLDIANQKLAETFNDFPEEKAALSILDRLPVETVYSNSVSIAKDGVTVLTTSYFDGLVHTLALDMCGHLTYVCSTDVSNDRKILPVNLSISPDGTTAIVASVVMYDNQYKVLPENMSFPVLAILAPGVTKLTGYAKPKILSTLTSSVQPIAAQSIAFNRLGNKAYAYCVQPIPDTNSDKATKSVAEQPMEVKDFIMEFTVARGGIIADTGKRWEVDFIGRSQLFGVDTIAFDDYDNNHLWISNMTVSDGRSHLQVLDVTTGAVIKTIPFAPIVMGDPPKSKDTIPTGIAFWRN